MVAGLPVPYPEDVPLLYAGIRISAGEWTFLPVLAVSMAGVYIRDLVAFGIGRWLGDHVLQGKWMKRWLGEKKLSRAMALVGGYGPHAVLIGRFMFGFRVPVFLVAGAMGVKRRHFLFWDALGLCVAVPAMVALGYGFGEPVIATVILLGRRFREGLLLTALFVIGAWLSWAWWRERKKNDETS